ncbi:MAG: GNAT family N-acetyltransferase [Oscillospiraceae bacterium]|nr:GNAT family N-acetyltransferase [Oscillospiraceae bacterium]
MSLPFRAAILDLDGTLIDSMSIWHEIDVQFFTENGLAVPEGISETVAKMSIEEWAAYFVAHYVPTMTPAAVIRRVEEMAADHYAHTIPLKPHVLPFLQFLDDNGIPYGICTATYRSSAAAVLARLGLTDRMQFVLTGEDFPAGKSDGTMFRTALGLLGTSPAETIVVDDALHCIETAVSCGCLTAAVRDASAPAADWARTASLADVAADDLAVLTDKLRTMAPPTVRIEDGTAYLPQIETLLREYTQRLGRDLSFQGFEAELRDIPKKYAPPYGALLAAVEDGQVLGMVAYHRHSASRCEMKRLYVSPAARGRHLGARLVASILARAAADGFSEMVLDTITPLKSAIRLYERFGFTPCAPYYANPMDDVINMVKRLG